MWSGPRNLSTAMMRSFGNRADTFVSDEPFYGAFLKASGAHHPMRDEVIAAMDCDWREHRPDPRRAGARTARPIWYQKHMWHHMVGPVGYRRFRRLHPRLPDPRPGADDRLLSAQARGGRVRGFRARPAGRLLRARGGPARPGAAGRRRRRRARRSRRRADRALRPRSASPSTRRCCAGRPAGARPTAPGRRTGTGRSRRAPASARPSRRRPTCPTRRAASPTAAGPYYERLAAHGESDPEPGMESSRIVRLWP